MSVNRQADTYAWLGHTGTATGKGKGISYELIQDYEYVVHHVLGPKHYVEQKKPDARARAG